MQRVPRKNMQEFSITVASRQKENTGVGNSIFNALLSIFYISVITFIY